MSVKASVFKRLGVTGSSAKHDEDFGITVPKERLATEFEQGISAKDAIACVIHAVNLKNGVMLDPYISPQKLADAKINGAPLTISTEESRLSVFKDVIDGLVRSRKLFTVRDELTRLISMASGVSKEHQWMTGKPDYVLEMASGKIYIASLYAPIGTGLEFPFRLQCELHQLYELSRIAKIKTDGLIVLRFDWNSLDFTPLVVPFDSSLTEMLYEGGDALWASIEKGVVPEPVKTESLSPIKASEKLQTKIADLEVEYINANAIAQAALKKKQVVESDIQSLIAEMPFSGQSRSDLLGLAVLGVNSTLHVQEDKIEQLFPSLGVKESLDDFKVSSTQYDVTAMLKKLLELGVETEQFKLKYLDTHKLLKALNHSGINAFSLIRSGVLLEEVQIIKRDSILPNARKDITETLDDIGHRCFQNAFEQANSEIASIFDVNDVDVQVQSQVDKFTASAFQKMLHSDDVYDGVIIVDHTDSANNQEHGSKAAAEQAVQKPRTGNVAVDWLTV